MSKVNIGENSRINVKWKVLPEDYSEEAEKSIQARFAEKYSIPKSHITVEAYVVKRDESGMEIPFSNETAENIQHPEFQLKLFQDYINKKGIKDCDFEKIKEIDTLINASICYDDYDKHKKYAIKWVKWSNFMSYGTNNFVDLSTLDGLVMLSSEPANQGGKSTFCVDLFRFLLFGKVTSREGEWTLPRAFNDHIPEATEVTVEGCITIDDVDYVIKRTLSRPALAKRTEKSKVTNKIEYYKVVGDNYVELKDDAENLDEGTVTNTNKAIKDAIGNEQDFDLMIYVNSDNLKKLVSLKDTERGRLLSRWIGLLPIEEKDKIARDTFNKRITPSLLLNKYNKETLQAEVTTLKNNNTELSSLVKKDEASKKKSLKKLEKLQEEKEQLLQSKKPIEQSLLSLDVETVERDLANIKSDGKILRETLENNKKRLGETEKVEFSEFDYKAKLGEKEKINGEIVLTRSDCKRTKDDAEALAKGEYCPTCGAKLKNVDNSKAIAEKNAQYATLVEKGKALKEKYTKLEAEIEELEKKRKQYNEREKLEILVQKNEVDIENLLSKYKEKQRLLNDLNTNKAVIAENGRIDAKINVAAATIKEEEKYRDGLVSTIQENNALIKANTIAIEENEKKITIIEGEEKLVAAWRLYLEMVGKNGICKMVLRNVLPVINSELSRLLAGVCDFTIEVSIDDRNDVVFYLVHDGVKRNLAAGSGFEQTVAGLALRSVLSRISTFSKPSFVVFDEILGGVAEENYDNIKHLYDKIVKDYGFILEISHLKSISDWHSSFLTVRKTNNISTIERN